MLLLIDNYDSFTYNLAQYFKVLKQDVLVKRNDSLDIATIEQMAPDHIVISPGPGSPKDAGISKQVVAHFAGQIPILGVCLGHQVIAEHFGATVGRAETVKHGKTSTIYHDNSSLFKKCKSPMSVARYHSLLVSSYQFPECLKVTAWTKTAEQAHHEIMALAHRELAIFGVQFHPEAILSEHGYQILENFIQHTAEPSKA